MEKKNDNKISSVLPEGKIIDFIDKKIRKDTPEEYVRQNIELRLVKELKYKTSQINIEYTLTTGSKKPRADIVLFKEKDLHNQDNVWMIIECKNEKIKSTDRKDGIGQLKSYMSSCPNCEWGMWTNSIEKIVFRKLFDDSEKKFIFEEYNDIPSANQKISEIDIPKRENLISAVEDNLLFAFKAAHNYIYATDGLQKQPAFFEFLKVVFCKIEDEKNVGHPLEFYATSEEKKSRDGQLTVKKRINKIFEKVKLKYSEIFSKGEEILLQPSSLSHIVSDFQRYSFLDTNIDIKGKAYEELVGANLRGDRGEFFTPRNVVEMLVSIMNPKPNELILDPTAGPGGFPERAMVKITENLKKDFVESFGDEETWTEQTKFLFEMKRKEVADNNIFGFDINPDLVKAAEMNMLMGHDATGNFLNANTLLPPYQWSSEFKERLAKKLKISETSITNHNSISFFDVLLSNPPFGSKIPVKDSFVLEQYDLAYIWQKNIDGFYEKTDRLQTSVPPEILFIERCYQFLKPGGRLGIVLPDAILGAPGLEYIRHWILEKFIFVASLDLNEDTFQPKNGTQTSILVLQKKKEDEEFLSRYNVFMSIIEKIGHDKRGNNIYVKDEKGLEVLVEKYDERTDTTQLKRLIDDDTVKIPSLFYDWKLNEGWIEW